MLTIWTSDCSRLAFRDFLGHYLSWKLAMAIRFLFLLDCASPEANTSLMSVLIFEFEWYMARFVVEGGHQKHVLQ